MQRVCDESINSYILCGGGGCVTGRLYTEHIDSSQTGVYMMRYEVQTNSFCDGFINMWSDDNEDPITWETKSEAERALALHLSDDKWLDPNSYRVAEVV